MIRTLCFGLFAAAAIAAFFALRAEISGKVSYRPNKWSPRQICTRVEDPKRFRDILFYQWAQAVMPAMAGWIILGIARRQDSLDPFAPGISTTEEPDSGPHEAKAKLRG